MRWMFVAGVIALAAIGLWRVPQDRSDRMIAEPGAVGTSGVHDGSAEVERGRVVTEIETITGANDGMTLVGHRVDLHVDVQSRANDHAFWVGSSDNRVLVVMGRDNRDGTKRQSGVPADHQIAPVRGGQRATVSGVIRPLPKAEEMASWNLTTDDQKEIAERKIYIRADSVSSDGHGTS